MHGKLKLLAVLAAALMVLGACQNDNYDTGDSKYSYLRADFGMAIVNSSGVVDHIVTDDDSILVPQEQLKFASLRGDNDSIRCLYYYRLNTAGNRVESVQLTTVPVLLAIDHSDTVHTDPLTLESAWVSAHQQYLNLGVIVKTGVNDSIDKAQTVGLMTDSIVTTTDGSKEVYLKLLHNQNNVPEYYSSKSYMSIPLKNWQGCKIHLRVNTYKGVTNRTF